MYGVTRPPYSELQVYSVYQAPKPEPTHTQIAMGNVPPQPDPEWLCVKCARLYDLALSPGSPVTPKDLMNPPIEADNSLIAWTDDSSLVLMVPVIEKGENLRGRMQLERALLLITGSCPFTHLMQCGNIHPDSFVSCFL